LNGQGANAWLAKVISLAERGDYKRAEVAVKKAARSVPGAAQVLFGVGTQAAMGKDYRKATFLLRQAIACDRNHFAAYANLGNVYRDEGKREQAVTVYRKALKLDPKAALIWSNLGSLCHEMGRGEEAEQCCRKALAIDPGQVNALINLGVILRAAGRLDEAEATQKRALELRPQASEIYCNLASIASERQRYEEAVAYCDQALRLNPTNRSAAANRASALFRAGHVEQALDTYARMARMAGGLAQGGSFDEALPCFEAAVRARLPLDGRGHVNYGLVLRDVRGGGRGRILDALVQDDLYTGPERPVKLATELAHTLPLPPGQSGEPLDRWLAEFQPWDVYDDAWWRGVLAGFGDPAKGGDKILRAVFSKVYGWSIPSREALQAVTDFAAGRRITSYGAGAGYWEFLLQRHFSVPLRASDIRLRNRFIEMALQDVQSAPVDPADVVFLGWVLNMEHVIERILRMLDRMAPGQGLVLVGDYDRAQGREPPCGSETFFDYLDRHFLPEGTAPVPRFAYLNDDVAFLRKRPQDPILARPGR